MWMQKVKNRAKRHKEWIFKQMPRLLKCNKKVLTFINDRVDKETEISVCPPRLQLEELVVLEG